MARAVAYSLWVLSAVLVCLSVFCCNLGKADEDIPEIGTGIVGGIPQSQTGTGVVGGVRQTGTGGVDADPAEVVAKALLCFNDKYIYSSCEEAYRLTVAGNLHVPPEYVDSFCTGACLSETHLVLNCIENIMKNFIFYNKATLKDLRDTIKAGCSYGGERGNFDVAEHLQYEENTAYKTACQCQVVLGLGFLFAGRALLL